MLVYSSLDKLDDRHVMNLQNKFILRGGKSEHRKW